MLDAAGRACVAHQSASICAGARCHTHINCRDRTRSGTFPDNCAVAPNQSSGKCAQMRIGVIVDFDIDRGVNVLDEAAIGHANQTASSRGAFTLDLSPNKAEISDCST